MLITDVVMPDMSGPELAQQLTNLYPNLKYLYISGYTEKELEDVALENRELLLLAKPFSIDSLARRIREILDA